MCMAVLHVYVCVCVYITCMDGDIHTHIEIRRHQNSCKWRYRQFRATPWVLELNPGL